MSISQQMPNKIPLHDPHAQTTQLPTLCLYACQPQKRPALKFRFNQQKLKLSILQLIQT